MKNVTISVLLLLSITITNITYSNNLSDLQQKIFYARNKVMPALVHVEPVRTVYNTGEKRHALVTGSGFIFRKDGYILTNHHVVVNAEKVQCTLFNKQKLSANVIGSDPSTDVAVIQINMEELSDSNFPFAQLGDSDSSEVGQIVIAMGSPLGLSRSASMGVISSIDRYFEDRGQMTSPYNLWIQTDAAINPGNSGGPLINLKGEVIGINARAVFMAENLGFAIPINLAKEVAEKLISGNKIRRSWIGLELQPIKELREYLDKPDLSGVLISSLDPFSPAVEAGLEPGDVIQTIHNKKVHANYDEDLPTIRKIIADLPIDEEIEINVWRNGKIKKIITKPQLEPFEFQPEFECEEWGLVVKNIDKNIFRIQNLPDYNGVLVSAVKSGESAEKAGLQAGDIIRSINKRKIANLNEYKTVYNTILESQDEFVFFESMRNGASYFSAIQIKK